MNLERSKSLYRGTQLVWYLLGLIEIILAMRFLLRLLGANTRAGFTDFIYTVSSIFTAPFDAVFRNARVEGSVFEWTTLLAMLVYWLIAWGIVKLFVIGKPVSSAEADVRIQEEDRV